MRQSGSPSPQLWSPQVPGLVQRGFLGASSEWSWQSNSPSHSHCLLLRHRPLAQRNSWGPQVGYSAGGRQAQTAWPTFPSSSAATGAPQPLGCAEPWHRCPNVSAAHLGTGLHRRGQGGSKRGWFWISPKLLCAKSDTLQQGLGQLFCGSLAPNPSHSLSWLPLTLLSRQTPSFWMKKTLLGSCLKAQETQCGCQGQCKRR